MKYREHPSHIKSAPLEQSTTVLVIQEGYVSDLACEEYHDDTSLVDTMFTP